MTVMVFNDSSSLQTANALAIRRGVYQDLRVFDRNAQSYVVSTATVVGPATRFFGIRFMKPRLLKVNLRLRAAGAMTFPDIQETVVAATNEVPDIFDAAWDRDLQDLQASIRSSRTLPELFALLSNGEERR